MTSAQPRVTVGQVFGNGVFRVMWLGELLSVFGDQLARVGLAYASKLVGSVGPDRAWRSPKR
jgi:hypothetical protein